jgi:DNA-binding NarL/FixJ family response regulator
MGLDDVSPMAKPNTIAAVARCSEREGLRGLLESEMDIQVVGEAAHQEEALALTARLAPDLILLDLRMPVKHGLATLSDLRHCYPQSRVLILTALNDSEALVQAMQLGAAGCLFKNASRAELVQAIEAAMHDSLPLDPQVATMLIRKVNQPSPPPKSVLTERELEILGQIAQGAGNGEIAQALGISEYTVRTHVSHILRKLRLPNRLQAALYFLNEQV